MYYTRARNAGGIATKTIVSKYVTTMEDGLEVKVTRDNMSPQRVIRAILALMQQWKQYCIILWSEPQFSIIVEEWKRVLLETEHTSEVFVRIVTSVPMVEDFNMFDLGYTCLSKALIMVFRKKNLELAYSKLSDSVTSGFFGICFLRIVVVGKCPPLLIRKYNTKESYHITLFPVDTTKWMNGERMKGNLPIYSLSPTDSNMTTLFPYLSVKPDQLIFDNIMNANKSKYGILEKAAVHVELFNIQNLVEIKNRKITGYFGDMMTYIQDYVKIEFHNPWFHLQNNTKLSDGYGQGAIICAAGLIIGPNINGWHPQFAYLPSVAYDGFSVFAKTYYFPMTFKTVISIFQPGVWILLMVLLLACNFCFFLAFHRSPSLQYFPRMRANHLAGILKLMTFDSLITFHMECPRGPNPATRWLLVSLNLLSFFMITVYLIVFSAKVLEDKRLLPFKDLEDLCDSEMMPVMASRDYVTINQMFTVLEFRSISLCVNFENARGRGARDTVKMLDGAIQGKWAVGVSTIVGENYYYNEPSVKHVKTALHHQPAGVTTSSSSMVKEIFSHYTLRLKEVGLVQRLKARYLKPKDPYIHPLERMTFMETWFSFAILGIAAVASVLILILERWI